MKVRVYSDGCFNNKYMPVVPPEKYVELDLGNYTRKDIERVGEDYFTACGKNCYLELVYLPENEKEEQMVRFFSWNKPGRAHLNWYTLQANYALKQEGDKNYILPHVNEETMSNLDKCLTEDKKAYLEWMRNN